MPETNKLRSTALAWLGRQEYSQHKFCEKLKKYEATEEQIELILEEFCQNDWLCEQRYCDAYVRGRVNKGQGKIRIRADARNKRLDQDNVNESLNKVDVDWFEQARATYYKRFGDMPVKDIKDKAKRLRFMQYRGFTMDEVNFAMNNDDDE